MRFYQKKFGIWRRKAKYALAKSQFSVGPNTFKHHLENFWESADTSMYKTWHFCPSVTVIQQSPQCVSCIFMNVFSLFISFWKWLGETNPRSLSFFTRILTFAVLALSGEVKTSGKVLKKYSYVLAMSRLPGMSKSKKGRGKGKRSRQEVSCSWTCGRYRSARTHIHTSFTTLRTTSPAQSQTPKGKATQRNVIKQAKEGRLLWVVGCEVSCNLEMRFGRSKHRKRACLGLSPPGRGQITLVQYCERAPWLHRMEYQSWANGYDLVLGLVVMLDVNPGCILAKGTSKLMNITLESISTMFIGMVCHIADDHGSAQSKSWSQRWRSGVS